MGGYGHLSRLKPLALRLLDTGHRVTLVARLPELTQSCFADIPVDIFKAPFYGKPIPNSLAQTPAYVHVLFNVGYGHQAILNRLVKDWSELLHWLSPDMIIADHAPTALMVSRDMGIPRINYGDGFTCPAPAYPLPALHTSVSIDEICADEAVVLGYCNNALMAQGLSPMETLGDLYRVDEILLMTLPALDHLGFREQMHYSGLCLIDEDGVEPDWPDGTGARLFAYLSVHPLLDLQLQLIADARSPAIVYVWGMPEDLREKYQCIPWLSLSDKPLSIPNVLNNADLVISNGGHQLTLQCLSAGMPQVHLPLQLEQQLLAARCHLTGSSLFGSANDLSFLLEAALGRLTHMSACARRSFSRQKVPSDPLSRCLALIQYWLGCVHN